MDLIFVDNLFSQLLSLINLYNTAPWKHFGLAWKILLLSWVFVLAFARTQNCLWTSLKKLNMFFIYYAISFSPINLKNIYPIFSSTLKKELIIFISVLLHLYLLYSSPAYLRSSSPYFPTKPITYDLMYVLQILTIS